MKTVMFFFLKVYVFENLLIFNALYQKYIANITLLNGVLHFSFTLYLTTLFQTMTRLKLCEVRWFCFSVCCKGDVNVCKFIFGRKLKKILIINNITRSII